jgi:hypothetical protein
VRYQQAHRPAVFCAERLTVVLERSTYPSWNALSDLLEDPGVHDDRSFLLHVGCRLTSRRPSLAPPPWFDRVGLRTSGVPGLDDGSEALPRHVTGCAGDRTTGRLTVVARTGEHRWAVKRALPDLRPL